MLLFSTFYLVAITHPHTFVLIKQNAMNTTNFTLRFGKYKGQSFSSTPKHYQDWLLAQDWFKLPTNEERMPTVSSSWDGHSRKGQAQYDAVFAWEQRQELKLDCKRGICSCCPDSKYYGM